MALPAVWPYAASARNMQLVVTVYDLIPELFPEVYLLDPGLRRRYRARLELIRAADHVVTLSQSAADDLVDRLAVPASRVTVIGASVAAAFAPPTSRQRARHEAQRWVPGLEGRYLLYTGGVEPRKNLERFLTAYSLLPADVRARWQAVLVCRMDELQRHHYDWRASQLGISGRLLLPGFVPDNALVTLYQGADLFVFPSLYEGYGLPVAEALACGTPSIAADRSSLREILPAEARFDPTDPSAIASAMLGALTDPVQLARLVARVAAAGPTWDDVADRLVEVYERLAAARAPAWRRRPRYAFVTPLPPANTGVADYSFRLLTALAVHADADVFVDGGGGEPVDGRAPVGVDAWPVGALEAVERARGGFDAIVYCIGNSEYHTGALRWLRRRPGVVLAHDVRLTELYFHGAHRGAAPEGFAAALRGMYPDLPGDVGAGGHLLAEEAEAAGVLMAREVVHCAERFLTTSQFAADLASTDVDPAARAKIVVAPYAYPDVAPASDPPMEAVVATFGVVNEIKRSSVVVDAFADLAKDRPQLRLVFVGPVAVEERARLRAQAEARGIGPRVEITGPLEPAEYDRWLGSVTVAVQLRATSNGETSGAIADCLAHGVPTVVSDLGTASHLPDYGVVKVGPGINASALAAVLGDLLDDPDRRAQLGDEARRFVRTHGFGWGAEALFRWLVTPVGVRPPR